MNQESFRYALYHNGEKDLQHVLDEIKAVEDFEIAVSIEETACRDKNPISDRRTTVNIEIDSNYSFKQLDRQIEENFVDVWFEH
jgi:hypothetical protein